MSDKSSSNTRFSAIANGTGSASFGIGPNSGEFLGPISIEQRDLTRQAVDSLGFADQGSSLSPDNPSWSNELASIAIGPIGGLQPVWVNGSDTTGTSHTDSQLNDAAPIPPLPSWELPGVNQDLSLGSNGGTHRTYPFSSHVLFYGAPCITGIGDIGGSADYWSANTLLIHNPAPIIIGSGEAGTIVSVFHNSTLIGSTTVDSLGVWSFGTPALATGRHDFSVSTIRAADGTVLESNHLDVRVMTDAGLPTTIATITSALDEFADPNGNHHDNVIQNGGKTADTSPKLLGTLSAALHHGEVLSVYRDGEKIGTAQVSGLGWSYQDTGLAPGSHTYSVGVESASGEHGSRSAAFIISETAGTSFDRFPMLATEDFLIFDTRSVVRTMSNGAPITFDLLESVKTLERAGMTVKSYTDNDGFISIEVDWMAFARTHPNQWIDFVSHRHVDNDHGGLNYYNTVSFPPLTELLNRLGTWQSAGFAADGAEYQSAKPAPATSITGVYDVYVDADGNPQQSLVPVGGATEASSHRVEGTISESVQFFSDWLVIYRDGVRLKGDNHSSNFPGTYSNLTWWIIDNDVPPGPHVYTARVERMYGEQGPWSESYGIVEAGAIPPIDTIATITTAFDEFTDPSGHLHQTAIENGGKTLDTSPKLAGTLSATLQDGEVLSVFRDGAKLGQADVSGRNWSFQDAGVDVGNHTYTVRVESVSGVEGAVSPDFSIIEVTGSGMDKLPLLVTDHFLILDIRGINSLSAAGAPMSFDLAETVNGLNKLGLDARIHSATDGYIAIEVDWMAYAESHPNNRIDFVSCLHIDNDHGGLNYYQGINVPSFGNLLKSLDTWVPTNFMADGPEWQSATPAPAATITGIYDSYTDTVGEPQLALVPAGGGTAESTHRIEGTLSEPMRMGSDWVVIYRDGVKLSGQVNAFEHGAYSNTTWWFVDTDVPPGSHVYTARVERAYGKQGEWSESYDIAGASSEPFPETTIARLMLTDGALLLDVQSLPPPKAGSSMIAAMGLSAELTVGGEQVSLLPAISDENGLVSFGADWSALAAAYPGATLKVTAHTGADDSIEILDKHTLSSLLGQTDRWVSMTSTGESAAFFDASDRGVHIHGGADINTIAIANDHQLLDLTSLTGKTIGSTIMGIDKIDLGGQHNTLKIAMIDVLNLGETDLFRIDGKQQLMVNGKAGDLVKLSNTRVAGIADGEWEEQGETKIGGVTYDVYEHSTAHVELMVQSGIQLTMH